MAGQVLRPATAALRLIALRLATPDLEVVAAQPGVVEAFRVTVRYHDGRHPDQIGTVIKRRGMTEAALTLAYRRPEDKPLILDLKISGETFSTFSAGLRKLNFDRLDDPPEIPWTGADLWLLERASASFHHDLIIAPDSAVGIYEEVTAAVRTHLKEALRMISL